MPLDVSFAQLRTVGGEDFVAALRDNAELVLRSLGVALYQVRRPPSGP